MILGSRGRYIDANVAYDLVEVVGMVPPENPNSATRECAGPSKT